MGTLQASVVFVALLCTLSGQVRAGNVLAVFPHYGFSHYKVVQPILDELAARGHQVTVISYVKTAQSNYEQLITAPAQENQNQTTINVVPLDEVEISRSPKLLLKEYVDLHVSGQKSCELLYASGHVQTVLQRHRLQPYDVLFTEYFDTDCQLAIAQQLRLPIVAVSTCALMPYFYDRIDLPDTPAFVQSEFIGFAQPLQWHERLLNFAQAKLLKLFYRYHSNAADNALVKRHLNIDVDVDAVARQQTAFVFVNHHYTLLGSRPHTRQLVELGGVHITEEAKSRELPARIEKFLAASNTGVLLISWGSMLVGSSIDATRLQAILTALQQQPLRVIWKWEAQEVPEMDSSKFLFVPWLPQLQLLCHPKVQLFWTHAGLLGTTEALHCGKPLLAMPIYGDQFVNAFAVQNRGLGLKLDYNSINADSLTRAIRQISQPSYAERAKQISRIFNARERTPLQTAVWCMEHVMQHGLAAVELLQSPGIEINWFVYHSLDSIALLLLPLLLVVWLLRRLRCRRAQQQKLKKS